MPNYILHIKTIDGREITSFPIISYCITKGIKNMKRKVSLKKDVYGRYIVYYNEAHIMNNDVRKRFTLSYEI